MHIQCKRAQYELVHRLPSACCLMQMYNKIARLYTDRIKKMIFSLEERYNKEMRKSVLYERNNGKV